MQMNVSAARVTRTFVPRRASPRWRAPVSRRLLISASGAGSQKSAPAPKASTDPAAAPWMIGFQCNERYLHWDDSATRQLIRITLAQRMDLSFEEVDARLGALAVLLPDMVSKLEACRVDVLQPLLEDTQRVADKLVQFRELLPGVNVSALVARCPDLLTQLSGEQVAAQLGRMRAALPGVAVESLVEHEPLLLRADVAAVLADLRRLLPGRDPVAVLCANPQMVLDMQTAGMPSSNLPEGI